MKFLAVFIILISSSLTHAYVEVSGFYSSDSFTTSSTYGSTAMFLELSVGFKVSKKGHFLVGWNYASYGTTSETTTSETYTSTQMGPRFIWFFTKNKTWNVGLSYNLVTSAAYSDGSSEVEWRGTGTKLDVGYNLELSENSMGCLRLNYSTTAYTEEFIGGTSYGTVSYARTHIYPSIAYIYTF